MLSDIKSERLYVFHSQASSNFVPLPNLKPFILSIICTLDLCALLFHSSQILGNQVLYTFALSTLKHNMEKNWATLSVKAPQLYFSDITTNRSPGDWAHQGKFSLLCRTPGLRDLLLYHINFSSNWQLLAMMITKAN